MSRYFSDAILTAHRIGAREDMSRHFGCHVAGAGTGRYYFDFDATRLIRR